MAGYDGIQFKQEMNDSFDVPMDWYPPDPERGGFSFAGWGAPAVDEGSRTVTITARWEPEHVHVWTMETEPDCIHPGREACSCGSSRETDPLGHDFTDAAWKDGHEGGHTDGCDSTHHVRACSRCGGTLEDGNEVQKAGHTYSEWKTIKEATDAEEGLKERHCLDCEHEEKEAVPIIPVQTPEPSPTPEQTPEPSPGPEQTPEPGPTLEQTPEPGQDIKEPKQESGLAVIEDEDTPLANVPQTGDPYPWQLLLFVSGLGLALMAICNRRRRPGR